MKGRKVPKLQLAHAIVERRLARIDPKRRGELDELESEARGSRRTVVEGPPVHGATPVCCHYHATGGALDIGCSSDQGPYLAVFRYELTRKGEAALAGLELADDVPADDEGRLQEGPDDFGPPDPEEGAP